jgi:hypothetical protein
MATILENIKSYFVKKDNQEKVNSAPEGVCPTCWGQSEWDGQYYELQKDKHLIPGGDIYESFISKVVDKHVNSTHKHEDKYICTTCDKEI